MKVAVIAGSVFLTGSAEKFETRLDISSTSRNYQLIRKADGAEVATGSNKANELPDVLPAGVTEIEYK